MSDSPHGITALIDKKVQEARQEERKMIADFIKGYEKLIDPKGVHVFGGVLAILARKIENGEYRKGEGE